MRDERLAQKAEHRSHDQVGYGAKAKVLKRRIRVEIERKSYWGEEDRKILRVCGEEGVTSSYLYFKRSLWLQCGKRIAREGVNWVYEFCSYCSNPGGVCWSHGPGWRWWRRRWGGIDTFERYREQI